MEGKIMIDLLKYIKPDSIIPVAETSYDKILKLMIFTCLDSYNEDIKQEVLTEIMNKRSSKAPLDINLGGGFVLIHAKNNRIDRIRLLLGLMPEGRNLMEGEPVQCFICIILPEKHGREYLSMLARLGRMLNQPDAGDRFSAAGKLLSEGLDEDGYKTILDYVKEFEKD